MWENSEWNSDSVEIRVQLNKMIIVFILGFIRREEGDEKNNNNKIILLPPKKRRRKI